MNKSKNFTMQDNNTSTFHDWYNNIVCEAGLIDYSPTRGCVIFKPYGYALWERIHLILDKKIKALGHENVYFPMLIPKSSFAVEAQHVQGFAKECAIVTHSRLQLQGENVCVDPESRLNEEYIIRPTSETVIWNAYHEWVHSYRDLPLKLNQWCNVYRWEMRTRPFLRTAEFLWQEGHTAHASEEEAQEEVKMILSVYESFMKDYLALPVVRGQKTEKEKFAGAVKTFTLEGLMQDGKALQCGTVHFLGQNFSRAFDVRYLDKDNIQQYAWGTSWGISTRLIGGLIMTHGDDKGLILPPNIAPLQIVIIPIIKDKNEINTFERYVDDLIEMLEKEDITVKFDDRAEYRTGYKFNEWEKKGVPIQIRIGMKDIENNTCEIYRRDNISKEIINKEEVFTYIKNLLKDIQQNIYNRALQFREAHTFACEDYNSFADKVKNKSGFVVYRYKQEEEERINTETSATVRCQPVDANGKIIDPTTAIFAQSY